MFRGTEGEQVEERESKQEKRPVCPPLDLPLSVPSIHSITVSVSVVKNTSLRGAVQGCTAELQHLGKHRMFNICSHFIDGETGIQRGEVAGPRSQNE